MISFLKMNKSLLTFSLIFLVFIPIFGFNFIISFIGNILLLIILIPLLVFLIILIGLNNFKSKVKICDQCGNVSLGLNKTCMNCGANLNIESDEKFETIRNPNKATIEVEAEEIK